MVGNEERPPDRYSVAFFCRTFSPKDKSKTVGFARQQLHFLCGDKENEAKENLALRLACLARYHSNINSAKIIRQSSYCSPVVDEALEDLSSSDL
jgi:hypothetical protein